MPKILGIDEVGRGAWAGPMVVGAVVLNDEKPSGLNDSKKLSPKKRATLATEIKKYAYGLGVGWVSAAMIDKIGLSKALKLAAERAVAQINCEYDEIIIDGTIKLIEGDHVSVLPKADGLVATVSAASIVAKVARDNYMAKLDDVFDGYNFANHVGYGTKKHMQAIMKKGVSPIHRHSFAPIKEFLGENKYVHAPASTLKTSVNIGNAAEEEAANFLISKNHIILARNWKTKYCEVDIISSKDDEIYFTEVKYRKSNMAGGGIDAIDQKKENQMRFAAKFYLESNKLAGKINAFVSAISLTGDPPKIETYIKNIS